MKRKIYAKRTVKILSLLLALFIFVELGEQYLFSHFDANTTRVTGFYLEEKNSLDVVMLGASEIYADFSPGYAYQKYGFTSYPFATGSNPVSLLKSQLKEVLDHQSPKMIVVEINGALYDDDVSTMKEANIRRYLDNVPFSSNKVDTIKAVVPNPRKQIDYFFPMKKYHGTWNDYPKPLKWVQGKISMQMRGYSLLKGMATTTEAPKPKKNMLKNLSNDNSVCDLTKKSEDYLRDFLQYCKDSNLKNILFVRLPHRVSPAKYNRFKRANKAGQIINEYGYNFINYEKNPEEIGLDYNKDFYNSDHMNVYGQKKFTEYFGKLLSRQYGVNGGNLSDKSKEQWANAADYARRFYVYSDSLIKSHKRLVLAEDANTMANLKKVKI